MRTETCIFAILLTAGLINSHAQDTWTQKADFGGTARNKAAGFSIGSTGYIGTGDDGVLKKDFWEYDPVTNAWIQKANFGGTGRANAAGFSIGSTGYFGDGYNGGYTNEFWAYDSTTNVWTQKASVGTARQYEVGFSIGGKGYIGTGYDGLPNYKKDFWEFDPSTSAWTQKANFGGTARALAVGFSIGSKGYIGTGNDISAARNDFWEYDPDTNTWSQKADFGGTARNWAVGFSIGNKGYIGTGYDPGVTKDFWEYDPVTDTWTQKTDFGGTARGRAVGFSIGSKGYIGTGADSAESLLKDLWEYTPETAQVPGTWTATGSMSIGRSHLTATLLTNGKVLIAGGCVGADCHADATTSVEVYDPSTGEWTSAHSMATPRINHTATLLANGKVLVAGGEGSTGAISSAELYDPITDTWTFTGSMNTPRTDYIATLINAGPLSGMVLVAGGSSVCAGCLPLLDSAELYDPNTGTWSLTGSMTLAREGLNSPEALPDGSVFVVGGNACCPYHWFNEAETFDPTREMWTPTSTKMTTANGKTIMLPDGRVLVAGGVSGTQPTNVNVATAELFDSSTGTWTATASMSTDRDAHTLTLLADGQALVAGGASGGWGVCNDLNTAELYDSNLGTWFPTGSMSAARIIFTATLLPNGQVLAAGGRDCEGNIRSSAELYTPPSVATLSTTSLTFGVELVNTHSAARNATLTNTGTTALTISSIAVSGDFIAENNCGSSLPAGASCTIRVAFNPSAKGVRTGRVTITDDAADSPQIIKLRGTGTVVQLSPSALDFGDQVVGTTSDPLTATITNVGSEDLHIFGIGLGGANFGDFAETTTCRSRLAAGGSCTIDVTFTPGARGHRHASLKIVDDGGASPQAVPLAGTGVRR